METKIIKVTDKGQISLPIQIRDSVGINVGDELIITRSGETICLKKINEEDFSDLLKLSEISLKEIWDNEEDEIWNTYLENAN
jgi:AbrB family looped-hinge helix DNA binding protein